MTIFKLRTNNSNLSQYLIDTYGILQLPGYQITVPYKITRHPEHPYKIMTHYRMKSQTRQFKIQNLIPTYCVQCTLYIQLFSVTQMAGSIFVPGIPLYMSMVPVPVPAFLYFSTKIKLLNEN